MIYILAIYVTHATNKNLNNWKMQLKFPEHKETNNSSTNIYSRMLELLNQK